MPIRPHCGDAQKHIHTSRLKDMRNLHGILRHVRCHPHGLAPCLSQLSNTFESSQKRWRHLASSCSRQSTGISSGDVQSAPFCTTAPKLHPESGNSGPLDARLNQQGYGSEPPPQLGDHPLWTSGVVQFPLAPKHRIYCNRALNMKQIKAIGFDMDYTLSQYRPETFEALAHKETIEKLVRNFNYPTCLRDFKFDCNYMVKGLIIDKKRGNVLKVDRHKYVKLAYHGFKPISPQERKREYNRDYQVLNFDSDDYALIDTLFSLAEAYLFMQLVELKDSRSPQSAPLAHKPYDTLYRELRTAVDMCHRDGSLKKEVAANPAKYIHTDPQLIQMLRMLRDSGRKVFLATNSLWDFTNVVMNYLLYSRSGANKTTEWLKYFDVVMVGCNKPAFFQDRGQLFSLDTKTGWLANTDNGAPVLPIDDADLASPVFEAPATSGGAANAVAAAADRQSMGTGAGGDGVGVPSASVFQGGCYKDLHRMLGVSAAEEVLYVGDHIYGDIVKSKKSLGWRTMLVIPELTVEISLAKHTEAVYEELRLLRMQRDSIDDQIQRYEWALKMGSVAKDSVPHAHKALEELREQRDELKAQHSALLLRHHRQFHPIWGQLLKTGTQNSRFASQIERFACLYTSHVSNLVYYSPEKSHMARMDYMAHEDYGDDLLV